MAKFLSQPDDEGLIHIGDIVTSFAVLEEILSHFLKELISENEQVGNVIISDLQFHRKLILTRSLCKVRMGLDEETERVLDEVDKISKKRNEIVHSLWLSDDAKGTAGECIKPTEWRKGVQLQTSRLSVKELDQISDRVDKAIGGLLSVWRGYKVARHK